MNSCSRWRDVRATLRASARVDAGILGCRELPRRRPDLPAGQPAAARAAAARAHQAAAARPLGHVARPELHLRAPEPADPGARRRRDLPGRSRTRRPGDRRQRLPGGDLLRDLSRGHAGRRRACGGSSASSRRRAASRATSACRRPGSIHEGGELGYVLVHAFGAAFDNPDLIVVAVVGDGEAETGPLEGSWKGISFLNPARDGAVLPILHLNGYKISGPTVLGRARDEDVERLLEGHGYDVHFVEGGDDLPAVHQAFAATLDTCYARIRRIQDDARAERRRRDRPRWPAIVLRTPKGWTGPKVVDGVPVEGTFRAHQVPLAGVREQPRAPRRCSRSGCAATGPRSSSTPTAGSSPELAALAPKGDRRMGANPHANGGKLVVDLDLPDFRDYALDGRQRRRPSGTSRRASSASCCATSSRATTQQANFRLFCPDETNSNRLGDVFEVENRCLVGRSDPDRRPRRARRPRDGGAERAPLPGLARGLPLTGRHGCSPTYEAFAMVSASMTVQHTKWLEEQREAAVARADPVAEHPADLDLLAQRPQRLQPPGAGPDRHGAARRRGPWRASTCRPTPTACCRSPTTACAAANYVNLIVIDKQPQLQWLDMDAAVRALRARRVGLGLGEQRRRRRAGRGAGVRPATSRRWRRSRRRGCCASTCPS